MSLLDRISFLTQAMRKNFCPMGQSRIGQRPTGAHGDVFKAGGHSRKHATENSFLEAALWHRPSSCRRLNSIPLLRRLTRGPKNFVSSDLPEWKQRTDWIILQSILIFLMKQEKRCLAALTLIRRPSRTHGCFSTLIFKLPRMPAVFV